MFERKGTWPGLSANEEFIARMWIPQAGDQACR
jgi:hypothetical protein